MPTLNLEGFAMNTPESEFKRVVRYEAGHTLGFVHEHMRSELVKRIHRAKAIEYFGFAPAHRALRFEHAGGVSCVVRPFAIA